MISNPLFDIKFLTQLIEQKEREIFARITALTKDELPIEYIEGKVTGGSINVDGNSAVRRTCNLTMVAKDININEFYWGLKNKFKLEIGLKNKINPIYPEIIWFKQGLYVITTFNTSQSTNNYNISISGKDKMCLLNGDLAGTLPHTTDFGIEEYFDGEITTYTSIPIKKIIREAVQNFGNELAHNIIINDIEDAGLELLEYRGDVPIYMFRENTSDIFLNMTLNGSQPCYYFDKENQEWKKTKIDDIQNIQYDNLIDIESEQESTSIKLDLNSKYEYKIAKFEYGSIPGYRLTDLTYAGDLIANVGETLTSVLDKIKNMLGEFEYFYNLDGKFVFQRKRNYIDAPWNSNENNDEVYIDAAVNKSSIIWSFTNSQLISAFQNTPNLLNLRNDFAVWGTKKTPVGAELDIHMRYAIDKKPTEYNSIAWYDNEGNIKKESEHFSTVDWDWRELIYRMALDYRQNYHRDDFLYELAQVNPQYPNGHTGYEQYYTDLEGFWRLLYNPEPELKFTVLTSAEEAMSVDNLYIQNSYKAAEEADLQNINSDYSNLYVIFDNMFYPFIQGYCHLEKNPEDDKYTTIKYYYKTTDGVMNSGTNSVEALISIDIKQLYIKDKENNFILFVDDCFNKISKELLYIEANNVSFNNLDSNAQNIYKDNNNYKNILVRYDINNFGEINKSKINEERIKYLNGYYDYYTNGKNKYWSKKISDNPENLLFWFDFLDAEGSDIAKYSVPVIGSRTKAINDKDVKSIYYREIPTTIFQTGEENYEHQTGYTYIQLQNTMENLFTISSKGKSAKERIDELLYNHSYCIENTSITTVPVYHLEPNSRIFIRDENSKVNGEYIVNKLTIPLTYNGTMNITATKAVSNIN